MLGIFGFIGCTKIMNDSTKADIFLKLVHLCQKRSKFIIKYTH